MNSTRSRLTITLLFACLQLATISNLKAADPAEHVSIDFTMTDKAIDWLQSVKDGASNDAGT